jgi:hypothetical protein
MLVEMGGEEQVPPCRWAGQIDVHKETQLSGVAGLDRLRRDSFSPTLGLLLMRVQMERASRPDLPSLGFSANIDVTIYH